MQVLLIRHAQSENNVWNEAGIRRRKVDPDLSELGYQQRECLGAYLESKEGSDDAIKLLRTGAIQRIYTSAMLRSLLTAQAVSQALGIQPQVWLDLHEKGGMFQKRDGQVDGHKGMTRGQIMRAFPDFQLPAELTEGGWYDPSLGMEPEPHSYYRAIKVARALRECAGGDEVIALISHAGFLDVLLKVMFEQIPDRPGSVRYYHYNTGITRILYEGTRPALVYQNRVEHLPAALRTY